MIIENSVGDLDIEWVCVNFLYLLLLIPDYQPRIRTTVHLLLLLPGGDHHRSLIFFNDPVS